MIFTVQPAYRNCPSCGKKVPYYGGDSAEQAFNMITDTPLLDCGKCGATFPVENTRLIRNVIAKCKQRLSDPGPHYVRYSKFYPIKDKYHHIYAMPLYSLNEILIVENLMNNHVGEDCSSWFASFDPEDSASPDMVHVRSWQCRLWDPKREMFYAGPDEGPRTLPYTNYE